MPLFPQYRGAAPINWAIINGETKTGVTTFFIDEKIDTGAISIQEELPIADNETAGSLHDKLMELGGKLVVKTVQQLKKEQLTLKSTHETALKKAPKLTAENTRIDWTILP